MVQGRRRQASGQTSGQTSRQTRRQRQTSRQETSKQAGPGRQTQAGKQSDYLARDGKP